MGAAHYSEAFAPSPDRCFRMVARTDADGVVAGGQPMHCPLPARWSGRFRAPNGRTCWVAACDGHAGDLIDARSFPPGMSSS